MRDHSGGQRFAGQWLLSVTLWLCLLTSAGSLPAADDRPSAQDQPPCTRLVATGFCSRFGRFLRWDDQRRGKQKHKNDDKGDDKDNGKNSDKDVDKDDDKDDDDKKDDEKDRLQSDRPDFTESTSTVGKGVFQLESGYTYTRNPEGKPSLNEHDLPELLLRYGIAERLELRAEWEGVVWTRSDRNATTPDNETGLTGATFGVKYAITKQDVWRPETSIIVGVEAPVESPNQGTGQAGAVVDYLYQWELTERLTLAGSTNHSWTSEANDWFSFLGQSLTLDYELTERLSVFNEFYALFRHDSDDNGTQCYYNGGLLYLVTKNFQLDWRAGWGLTDSSDRFFTGCGLVIRR
jgi:hypothetical protein